MGRTELTGNFVNGVLSISEFSIGGSSVILTDNQGQGLVVPLNDVICFELRVTSIVVVAGGGGLSVGDSYSEVFLGSIKNVGGVTSLVGTVDSLGVFSDTDMLTTVITVSSDDVLDCLEVEYTPSALSDVDTVISIHGVLTYVSA